MRWAFGCLVLLLGAVCSAQGARIVMVPLEAPEIDPEQRTVLENIFAVSLARITSVRLVGGDRTNLARARATAGRCATPEACLELLAVETGALYAVSARLSPNAQGTELMASASVVRADGEVMRRISLNSPLLKDRELAACATELLGVLVQGLELGKLPATPPVKLAPPTLGQASPEAASVEPQGLSTRRLLGIGSIGLGAAALLGGGVMFGLAARERSNLTVSPAAHAASVRSQQIATGVIPVGAAFAVIGGLLALWPERQPVKVSLGASAEGGGVLVSGSFR